MPIQPILRLGHPDLLIRCTPVDRDESPSLGRLEEDLRDTMRAFRATHGWGRGIAAPQIGVPRRVVYLDVEGLGFLVNPKIVDASPEIIELWDDCMSFPDLLVRVRRHARCRIRFRDTRWHRHELEADGSLAELLQHEIDHLDGVIATMRAIDGTAFALASERAHLAAGSFANPSEAPNDQTGAASPTAGAP